MMRALTLLALLILPWGAASAQQTGPALSYANSAPTSILTSSVTGRSGATLLTSYFNKATAGSGTAFILFANPSQPEVFLNRTGATALLFEPVGDTIEGGATSASVDVVNGGSATCKPETTAPTNWECW